MIILNKNLKIQKIKIKLRKKSLIDRSTQTPKINGLENISLMIEEQIQQNDEDEEWNKMKEDAIVLASQNERLKIDHIQLSTQIYLLKKRFDGFTI